MCGGAANDDIMYDVGRGTEWPSRTHRGCALTEASCVCEGLGAVARSQTKESLWHTEGFENARVTAYLFIYTIFLIFICV